MENVRFLFAFICFGTSNKQQQQQQQQQLLHQENKRENKARCSANNKCENEIL